MAGSTQKMNGPGGWAAKYRARLAASDAFVVLMVMALAQFVRFGSTTDKSVSGPSAPPYFLVTMIIGVAWWAALGVTRSREARILGHGSQEFQRVLQATWVTFAAVAILAFLTQWDISRGYLLIAAPLGIVSLLAYRGAWRLFVHAQRDAGLLQAQVLVVGPSRMSEQLIERLRGTRRAGLNVVGVCLPPAASGDLPDQLAGVRVLGGIDAALEVALQVGAEYIVLSGNDEMSLTESRRLGWSLEGTGIELIVAPAMVDIAGPRVLMSPVEGVPLIHVDTPTFDGGKYYLKTAADKVSSVALLAIALVPMLVVAAVIKATAPGPVLFRQERIGQNGEPFTMFKFRSMVVGAEESLKETMGGSVGVYYKNKNDPRVTPVGRFLRRYSLDELPQLINVLNGTMSVVGPRPQVAEEVAQYTDLAGRRLLVKPGVTGLWQVSGRSSLTPEASILLDAYYAENWSLVGDALILLRTAQAVLGRDGAY